MKRLISLCITFMLLISLCACGKSSPASTEPAQAVPAPTESVTESTVQTSQETSTEKSITEPEPTSEVSEPVKSVDIPWTEVTYSVSDSEGYTFDVTFKLSPWILLSNSELIDTAWNEVGNGHTLPQFNDWGFKKNGSGYQNTLSWYRSTYAPTLSWSMTDMFYSVGTVTIKNTTQGFDVTSTSPRAVMFPFGTDNAWTVGKVMYSNETVTRQNGFLVRANLKSNNWGPAPLVLMTPENISPNTPDGLAESILSDDYILDFSYPEYTLGFSGSITLTSENTQVLLGILNGKGEYITE